ncbi:MAG: flagellar basal body-associated FliL family protein [Verrucomicrobiota bacterium]
MPPPPKSDAKSSAKPEAAAEAPASPVAVAAPAGRGGFKAWLPAIAALLLAPAATWATVEFVLVPRIQKKLTAAPAGDHPAAETAAPTPGGGAHGKGKDAKEGAPNYEFQNVVVNLAGTMGTRYLKTSFLVTGADANIKAIFDGAKPKLTDVTLNVLSSLTLADLEEPGAKNVIRERLVTSYNQALGRKVAEQVYFSDFVIQ